MKDFREVMLDIETNHLKGDFGHVLCAVFKPVGGKPIVLRLDDYKGYKDKLWDDSPLIADIIKILNQTVKVVTWYGARFDIPFLRTRRLLNGIDASNDFLHFDAINIRRWFVFHNNRLETYMNLLTKYKKTDILPGQWIRASYGSRKDMDYVVQHCVADVGGLEEVYLELEKTTYMKNWRRENV